MIILTVGVEEFASFVVFECPCDRSYNFRYGYIYMFAPAVVLFIAAMVRQKMFWHLITGCCRGNVHVSATGVQISRALILL